MSGAFLFGPQVEILADDGDDSGVAVEAGEVGTVTATSDVYDTRLAAANGCDPEGCTAALTRVRLSRFTVYM